MTQPRCRSPLANVPKPIPHQTVESLAALLALENVSFMSPESHQPRQQTIGARARSCLLDTVSNALGDSTVQTAKRFGHESILTMCLSTSQFEQVTRGLPLNDSLRSVLLISSAIRFCPRCMADDFRERGFAAARVSHQYLGVRACHLHGIALVLLPQGRVDFNEQAGLLLDERLLERPDFRTPLPKPALFDLKFSKFVHAAVTGTLHSLHGKEWLPRVAQAASRWSISNSLPFIAYAAYDLTQFQPRRSEISTILQQAAPQDRNPPEQVVRMLKASEQRNGPSVYAARLLGEELNAVSPHGSMIGWHINSALWWSVVRLHLTEEEQTAVFLSLAPTGKDRKGFTATALALYRRQPAELSLAEVATIMALIRRPSAQGQTLERIRDMLLARYESGV